MNKNKKTQIKNVKREVWKRLILNTQELEVIHEIGGMSTVQDVRFWGYWSDVEYWMKRQDKLWDKLSVEELQGVIDRIKIDNKEELSWNQFKSRFRDSGWQDFLQTADEKLMGWMDLSKESEDSVIRDYMENRWLEKREELMRDILPKECTMKEWVRWTKWIEEAEIIHSEDWVVLKNKDQDWMKKAWQEEIAKVGLEKGWEWIQEADDPVGIQQEVKKKIEEELLTWNRQEWRMLERFGGFWEDRLEKGALSYREIQKTVEALKRRYRRKDVGSRENAEKRLQAIKNLNNSRLELEGESWEVLTAKARQLAKIVKIKREKKGNKSAAFEGDWIPSEPWFTWIEAKSLEDQKRVWNEIVKWKKMSWSPIIEGYTWDPDDESVLIRTGLWINPGEARELKIKDPELKLQVVQEIESEWSRMIKLKLKKKQGLKEIKLKDPMLWTSWIEGLVKRGYEGVTSKEWSRWYIDQLQSSYEGSAPLQILYLLNQDRIGITDWVGGMKEEEWDRIRSIKKPVWNEDLDDDLERIGSGWIHFLDPNHWIECWNNQSEGWSDRMINALMAEIAFKDKKQEWTKKIENGDFYSASLRLNWKDVSKEEWIEKICHKCDEASQNGDKKLIRQETGIKNKIQKHAEKWDEKELMRILETRQQEKKQQPQYLGLGVLELRIWDVIKKEMDTWTQQEWEKRVKLMNIQSDNMLKNWLLIEWLNDNVAIEWDVLENKTWEEGNWIVDVLKSYQMYKKSKEWDDEKTSLFSKIEAWKIKHELSIEFEFKSEIHEVQKRGSRL